MTTAKRCSSMTEVRREIDRIDRQLVPLIAERAGNIAEAARLKTCESRVRDTARIEEVVANVRSKAVQAGLDLDLAEAIWRPMIEAFIAHEMALFQRHAEPR